MESAAGSPARRERDFQAQVTPRTNQSKTRWPRLATARGHVEGRPDPLVTANPLAEEIGHWRRWLMASEEQETLEALRLHARTGRPLGGKRFLERLERIVGRGVRPGRPGRPRKRT